MKHLRSNAVAYLALFFALTATGYAAGLAKDSVRSKQIKDGQVRNSDLGASSVDGSKIADGSLSGSDFGGSLPSGAQGPAGVDGEDGSPDTGAQILGKLAPVGGAGSGLDADELDGLSSNAFQPAGAGAGGDLAGTYPNPTLKPGAAVKSTYASFDPTPGTPVGGSFATVFGTDQAGSAGASGPALAGFGFSAPSRITGSGFVNVRNGGIGGVTVVACHLTAFNLTGSDLNAQMAPDTVVTIPGGSSVSLPLEGMNEQTNGSDTDEPFDLHADCRVTNGNTDGIVVDSGFISGYRTKI